MPINNVADLMTSQLQPGNEAKQAENLRTQENSPAQRPMPTNAGANDTVTLTDTARQLNQVEQRIQEMPVVDTQRVEQAKRAIADGSFAVNPERIADQLINLEQGLQANGR